MRPCLSLWEGRAEAESRRYRRRGRPDELASSPREVSFLARSHTPSKVFSAVHRVITTLRDTSMCLLALLSFWTRYIPSQADE